MQELHAVKHWINQKGWDVAGGGRASSPSTGKEIDLRLDWGEVKKKLAAGAGQDVDAALVPVDEEAVLGDYALNKLDPTQRAFADRVLAWADEVVSTYRQVSATGKQLRPPALRAWLGGSAGSG